MESSLIPVRRRPTAKFGNTEFPINFHKKQEPLKVVHKVNAQQILNASENIGNRQYENLESPQSKPNIVESEKVMFIRNMSHYDPLLIKKQIKHQNFNQFTNSELIDDHPYVKDNELMIKSKYLDSQHTPSLGTRTLRTTSANFQPHLNPEYTSINDRATEFKDLPSDMGIIPGPFEDNTLTKNISLQRDNGEQRSEEHSKKNCQQGKSKKKKTYRTENPKKKGKKRQSNNVSIQSFQNTQEEYIKKSNPNRRRKMKTKSTQNFYKKQFNLKKKKMLIPPKSGEREKKRKRIQNHSLDRSNLSKISNSKMSKNSKKFKKCMKKGKPYTKLKSSNFDNLRTVKDNSSYMLIQDMKKPKKNKKLRTNSFNKSKRSKRTTSREGPFKRPKTGLKEMEEKILRKKMPIRNRRSSNNLIHEITKFSHSGVDTDKSSFIKKNIPAEYKSKKKQPKNNQIRNKNSIISSKQSSYSKKRQLNEINQDNSSDSEDEEEGSIFIKIQTILMNGHEQLRNFAHSFRDIQKNSLPRIYIGNIDLI
jgi:hypothetical protein